MGLANKRNFAKFRSSFKKRLRVLEKNLAMCCDPYVEQYTPMYKKNDYEVPEEYYTSKLLKGSKEDGMSSMGKSRELTSVRDKTKATRKHTMMNLTMGQLNNETVGDGTPSPGKQIR